ncbi:hypothetical protein SteCoe_21462 [Stentor coeruleus]|uniref:TRP C-terminal domain-containing protein n=1 Tax=Stentor coeruleus TaxID=5963 RepID=A0A1R2BP88_9CILI|nr:hypothetical protein SteCoe_21462 [Stentor coeruleus]
MSYFEVGMASIIAIKFCIYNILEQKINFEVSFVLLVTEFFIAMIIIGLVYKRNNIEPEDSELDEFLLKYGTLFEEFYNRGISDWIYYPMLILRKISLMVLSTTSIPGNIAIFISGIFSFANLIYSWYVRPYKSKISLIYNIAIEIIILSVHAVVFATHNNLVRFSKHSLALACIWIIFAGWMLNSLYSILSILLRIKEYIYNRKVRVGIEAADTSPVNLVVSSYRNNKFSETSQDIIFSKRL